MEWNKPCTVSIGKIDYPRGSLSALEYPDTLPFEPVDARWLTAETPDAITDGRAHYAANLAITALTGSLRIVTEQGGRIRDIVLACPNKIAYVPAMTWYEITEFSQGAVALIVSDALPDAPDVITDKREFDSIASDGIE